MIDSAQRTVVLLDGSVESLTCAAIALDRMEHSPQSMRAIPLAFVDQEHGVPCSSRTEALSRQFDYLGVNPTQSELQPVIGVVGLATAISQAGPEGTILWPRRCTNDPEGIARTLSLVEHLTGLAHCSHPGSSLEIELPLLDLSPTQVLELGASLGTPFQASWPCEAAGTQTCHQCDGCLIWIEASERSGRALPWISQPVAP